jgi:hypothetical protein
MKEQIIYPGETAKVNYWLKRWGITMDELNEAILETGSLKRKELKNYLKRKKIPLSLSGIFRFIRLSV